MPSVQVNALLSAAGWTADAGLSVETQGFPEYAASGHPTSVAMRVSAGSRGRSASLPLSFDAGAYEALTLSVASLRAPSGQLRTGSEATYSITLADGQEFLVPVGGSLSKVTVPVDGLSGVTRLQVRVLHDGPDYLVLSDLRASAGPLDQDLLAGVKSALEAERDRLSPGRDIGTVTAAAGDLAVVVGGNWDWLERNVVLRIGSGAGAEVHQVLNVRDNRATFMTTYDGDSLLYDHVDSRAAVTFPVEVGYYDREAALPGVAIWRASPEPVERRSRAAREVLCVGPLGQYVRREGALSRWEVTLEVAARSPGLVADASRAVRAFLAKSTVWVAGERLWFDWKDPSSDSEPVEGYDIVPRSTYSVGVEIREDSWELERTGPGSAALTVTPYAS